VSGSAPWSSYFVDLPGYGYARGGDDSATELAAVVDAYFAAGQRRPPASSDGSAPAREPRGGIFLLIDSRHPGMASDVQAYEWISQTVAPHLIATKIDKLSRAERTRNLREIERTFGPVPVPVSATSGEGLDQLWRLISTLASPREVT
jgi:GTP-binding protein